MFLQQLLSPWGLGATAHLPRMSGGLACFSCACCWWSNQTPAERPRMLQRRHGAALLSHLWSKSRITMIICYLTKGTWQAGLFKVTNQPHQVFWLQQMKQLKQGQQNGNKPASYFIILHTGKLLESSNFQVFTSWQAQYLEHYYHVSSFSAWYVWSRKSHLLRRPQCFHPRECNYGKTCNSFQLFALWVIESTSQQLRQRVCCFHQACNLIHEQLLFRCPVTAVC